MQKNSKSIRPQSCKPKQCCRGEGEEYKRLPVRIEQRDEHKQKNMQPAKGGKEGLVLKEKQTQKVNRDATNMLKGGKTELRRWIAERRTRDQMLQGCEKGRCCLADTRARRNDIRKKRRLVILAQKKDQRWGTLEETKDHHQGSSQGVGRGRIKDRKSQSTWQSEASSVERMVLKQGKEDYALHGESRTWKRPDGGDQAVKAREVNDHPGHFKTALRKKRWLIENSKIGTKSLATLIVPNNQWTKKKGTQKTANGGKIQENV